MNGHKFVQRQFYQIILCAFCSEFLLNAVGYQCEDCRYTCHKKCYEKVVTKCISKSNTGVSVSLRPSTRLSLILPSGRRRGENQPSHPAQIRAYHQHRRKLVLSLWLYASSGSQERSQMHRMRHHMSRQLCASGT